jgi:hypothetical protein
MRQNSIRNYFNSIAMTLPILLHTGGAQAADIGGNCCADLEQRIAELEATSARKGNRKVTLTVSGQVNEAVMAWDDGVERNIYQATDVTVRSLFRFVGTAKLDGAWAAGYLLEIGVRGNDSSAVSQDISKGGTGLDVRHSAWWLSHKDAGKLWMGQTSAAADGITEINLANIGHFIKPQIQDYIGSFAMRRSNGTLSTVTVSTLTNGLANPGEGNRFNVIKYETPEIGGFIGSASWGEDDAWEGALRFADQFDDIKFAAGIAYAKWNDATSNPRTCARVAAANSSVSCDELGMSASIMHVSTGLYVTGAYGYRDDDNISKVVAGTKSKSDFYNINGGIEKAFFPIGKTTIFGEYFNGGYGAAITKGVASPSSFAAGVSGASIGIGAINATEIKMWGASVNQNIAAASTDLYIDYRSYGFDVSDTTGKKANLNDLKTVVMGARIQF